MSGLRDVMVGVLVVLVVVLLMVAMMLLRRPPTSPAPVWDQVACFQQGRPIVQLIVERDALAVGATLAGDCVTIRDVGSGVARVRPVAAAETPPPPVPSPRPTL